MALVIVGGYAGSGKTEFAKTLARMYPAALLDKDTVSRHLVEKINFQLSGDPHDRESDLYLSDVRPLEYQCLLDTAIENLANGTNVIATAPWIREIASAKWRRETERLLAYLDHDLHICWVHSDAPTMKLRIAQRNAQRDRWKMHHWQQYEASIDPDRFWDYADIVIANSEGSPPLYDQAMTVYERIRD